MNSLIKETNDNLKAIIDTMKGNLDSSVSTLENIQMQMDKKVEEAKKYKVQVDSAKEIIKGLESDNKSLDLSLKELNDKYGKMNLVSVIEAGNREIKAKINDNMREINKQKEHIAELTSKARTIKDLLMNLKKDKSSKEDRLENLRVVYEYYSTRINDVIDYAFNHSENLVDFKEVNFFDRGIDVEESPEIDSKELDNTMVFDEIASIDSNKNFKDEMSFITEQIDKNVDYKTLDEEDEEETSGFEVDLNSSLEENLENEYPEDLLDTTQMFNSIILDEENEKVENVEETEPMTLEEAIDKKYAELEGQQTDIAKELELLDDTVEDESSQDVIEDIPSEDVVIPDEKKEELSLDINTGLDEQDDLENTYLDEQNEERISKINNLFSTLDNIDVNAVNTDVDTEVNPFADNLLNQIDNAYEETFEQPITEETTLGTTVTDIFGNPINDIEEEKFDSKNIEDLFVENGIDFNKFKEDEKNYLKQIYDEEKFNNIFATLKRNKKSVENVYDSFNVFGEISANELESVISKLLGIGQSAEAIGIILEKLPRVKKYNLDEAIMSYGDYIKDIDITELVMKAKELYKNGGNN